VASSPASPIALASPATHWRARRIALIMVGALLFLALSGLLARFLSVENAERDDLVALLQAQARGDAPAMLRQLSGCRESPSCTAAVQADAAKLQRPGAIKILTLTSPTAYSPSGASGTTRVAWTVIGRLPVVQCVRVRRSGNAITGVKVALLSIGAQIPGENDC
jgi:hypothetical protein